MQARAGVLVSVPACELSQSYKHHWWRGSDRKHERGLHVEPSSRLHRASNTTKGQFCSSQDAAAVLLSSFGSPSGRPFAACTWVQLLRMYKTPRPCGSASPTGILRARETYWALDGVAGGS